MHLEVRRHAAGLLCLLLIFLLLLSGCGGEAGGTRDPSGTYVPPEPTGGELSLSPAEATASPDPVLSAADTLTLACRPLEPCLNPFFAVGEGNRTVLRLTQLPLLAGDAQGVPATEAPEGQIPGAAGVKCSPRDDGSTVCRISMREDLRFSDGSYADVTDLLFTLYVCLDPDYDGPSGLKDCALRGLAEYRCQTRQVEVCRELYREAAAGTGPYVQMAEAALEEAWRQSLARLTELCRDSYLDAYAEYALGMSPERVREDGGLLRAFTLWCAGLGETVGEDGVLYDMLGGAWYLAGGHCPEETDLSRIFAGCFGSPEACDEQLGTGVAAAAEEHFLRRLVQREPEYRESVPAVSGIRQIDDYTLEITVEGDAEALLLCLGELYLVPLDAYGDPEAFRPEEGRYGFAYGDLSAIRSDPGNSGAGPYFLRAWEGEVPYLEANPYYYLGTPGIRAVDFLSMPEEEMLDAVAQGLADAALLSGSPERFRKAESLGLASYGVAADVFGYLALWDDGNALETQAERDLLNRAVLTVLQAHCACSAEAYFGAAAQVIPAPTAEAAGAEAETLLKELAHLPSAGETGERQAVRMQLLIPGGGTGDHPCWEGALAAAEQLKELGIELQVTDVRSDSEFWELVDRHEAAAWAAARQCRPFPELTAGPEAEDGSIRVTLYQRCDLAVFSPERVQKDSIPAGQTLSCDWISRIQDLRLR